MGFPGCRITLEAKMLQNLLDKYLGIFSFTSDFVEFSPPKFLHYLL